MGRKRRKRPSAGVTGGGLPNLESKLEEEDYYRQQGEARREASARKARAIAEDERQKAESEGNHPVDPRRRSHGGNPRQAGHQPGKRNAGRRLSAPAVLSVCQPTSKKRRKACERMECGWVTDHPGTECSKCPGSVVHSHDDKLCSACHRSPNDDGFRHLRADRLGRAVDFVAAWRQGQKTLPSALVRDLRPSNDCLCARPDCFLRQLLSKWLQSTCLLYTSPSPRD